MPLNNSGIVRVVRGGNVGEKISFQFENGKSGTGIAKTTVTTGWATFVRTPNGEIALYGERPSERVLLSLEGGQLLEEEILEVENLLPFVVLATSELDNGDNIQIGGDRNQIIVATAGDVLKAGISNRGNLEYISVWLDISQLSKDDNGAQTISVFPPFLDPNDFSWVGNGFLNANLFTAFPEENLEESVIGDVLVVELPNFDTEGNPLPPTVISYVPPLYPEPRPFIASFRRQGVTVNTQESDGYSYNKTENYQYKHVIGGDSGLDPNPNLPDNFCGSGVGFTTLEFTRETGMEYDRTVNESLVGTAQVLFNDQVYSGERTETYQETYNYEQTTSIPFGSSNPFLAEKFSVISFYACVNFTPGFFPGVYLWVPSANRSGIFRGEDHITDKDSTRIINEPEWNKPITLGFTRIQKHLLKEIVEEDTTLSFPLEAWSVNPFEFTFQYPVIGLEVKNITIDYDEDRIFPSTKIISADGSSSLFTEKTEKELSIFTSDSTTEYTKYNDIDIILPNQLVTVELVEGVAVETVSQSWVHLEKRIVTEKIDYESFYLALGGQLVEIETDNNWCFSVLTEAQLSTGVFTLTNDDDTPIFVSKLNRITAYVEDRNVITQTLEEALSNPPGDQFLFYSDVEEQEISFWANIEQEPVFLQSGANRYQGKVLAYDFTDEPDENIPIQIIRKVNSITIQIDSVQGYVPGISEENEVVIYPISNCAVLVRDRLLAEENRVFCNLVQNQLFFSKSVSFDLSAGEQQTEVYTIGTVITQDGAQSGAFLPMAAIDNVLGVSYFPQ